MKKGLVYRILRVVSILSLLVLLSNLPLQASIGSGQLFVYAVSGNVQFSLDDATWQPLEANTTVEAGAMIKTSADSTADIMLKYNGSVLRLAPDSKLRLEKLSAETAGEETITETRLNLLQGNIVGSQRKLHKPSQLEIVTPNATATIRGTEYVVNASGAVSVLSGTVSVNYNLPGNGGDIKVTVQPGQTFDPATGKVVATATNPDFLNNRIADINTVKQNAQVFKAGGATIVVKGEAESVSPTQPKGNNGVGNGVDPQPPGNPPVNDGPGTSPGNPGNKGGAKK